MAADPSVLKEAAARFAQSGMLGDGKQRRLFDYLLAASLANQPPKEIAIAIDVFAKDASYDVSQDAFVRVYIHKLRKALEAFNAGAANEGLATLQIPRGEYRLVAVPPAVSDTAVVRDSPLRPTRSARLPWYLAAALAALLLISLATLVFMNARRSPLDLVRADSLWADLLNDERPLMIVVGDYYLIGETDPSMEIKRLVREYNVNSPMDLDAYVQVHPEVADKYVDVGLRYVPTSTAYALGDVMPVVNNGRRHVVVAKMSDVTPTVLKTNDIVYLGYLSGLGVLQDLVFSGSHFAIADSYDELRDKDTNKVYISQTASESIGGTKRPGEDQSYRDYGFLSHFSRSRGQPHRGDRGNAR